MATTIADAQEIIRRAEIEQCAKDLGIDLYEDDGKINRVLWDMVEEYLRG